MEAIHRVLLFTGDGKGKTTAALGLSMRAAGRGMRVCVIQFVKSPDAATGETAFLEQTPSIDLIRAGLGRIPPAGSATFQRHRQAAQEGLGHAIDALSSGGYGLIILDEVCVAVEKGLLEAGQVCELVARASADQVVVMTGRNAPPELVTISDTVTEMRNLKHAFETGRAAQKGVEM